MSKKNHKRKRQLNSVRLKQIARSNPKCRGDLRKSCSGKPQRVTDEVIQQGFPGAKRIKSTNYIPGGSQRKTWEYGKGKKILTEDTENGTVEMFQKSNREHLGEYDPQTGKQTKLPNPKRKL